MKFILLEALTTAGVGLVQEPDGNIYLYKPPFNYYTKRYISDEEYRLGAVHYGFTELNETYTSIQEILERLKNMLWEARKKAGDTKKFIDNDDYAKYLISIPRALLPSTIEKINGYFSEERFKVVAFIAENLLKNPRLSEEQIQSVNEILKNAIHETDKNLQKPFILFHIPVNKYLSKAQRFQASFTPQY